MSQQHSLRFLSVCLKQLGWIGWEHNYQSNGKDVHGLYPLVKVSSTKYSRASFGWSQGPLSRFPMPCGGGGEATALPFQSCLLPTCHTAATVYLWGPSSRSSRPLPKPPSSSTPWILTESHSLGPCNCHCMLGYLTAVLPYISIS